MHELHIAQNILDNAVTHCLQSGCSLIESVTVELGLASGVTSEGLSLAFDAVKVGTIAETSTLITEKVTPQCVCKHCAKTFEPVDRFVLICPVCNSTDVSATKGFELHLLYVEAV
ncbi:hydrogenase maturation nickel metallochaperone HypA/HybF [Candidatus Magnetomonas plexicatena]|uniref:hydrogenase maturation nickel metallochaperone HypA/HybF n=1 Tax=Candidatus Magnetomonas plexicatena TaxID=2552947 RepID=UPI001C75F0C3|nr:hydrogenase maturation nickel metallochaperone HypA [Nitrospirales bacterium LBB_01]